MAGAMAALEGRLVRLGLEEPAEEESAMLALEDVLRLMVGSLERSKAIGNPSSSPLGPE